MYPKYDRWMKGMFLSMVNSIHSIRRVQKTTKMYYMKISTLHDPTKSEAYQAWAVNEIGKVEIRLQYNDWKYKYKVREI